MNAIATELKGGEQMAERGVSGSCLIFAVFIGAALSLGWSDSWDGISSSFRDVRSVNAEFVQEKHMRILSRPFVSKGLFCYQSPGSLRWEYLSPVKSILLMHKGKAMRYTEKDEGLVRDSGANFQAMQIILQEITMWLNGRFTENPNFKVSLEPGRKITLTPKKESFSKIIMRTEIFLSPDPGIIESLMIYEGEDSFTKIGFRSVRLNETVNDSFFQKIQ